MKVESLISDHDTTVGKVYDTIDPPHWAGYAGESSVWVIDDVGKEYILYGDEYEVINE